MMKDQAMFDILNKFVEKNPEAPTSLKPETPQLNENQLPPELMRDPVGEDTIAQKSSISDYIGSRDKEKMDDLRPQAKDKGLGPVIKTLKTQDGKTVKIHGNEDDGFRVALHGKPHKAVFNSIERALMACESYIKKKDTEFLESK